MKSFQIKFPRRVRIHGGECGAVARALHHEAHEGALTQNEQTLISDEKAFMRQAGSKKAFGSTLNERKQMSTKTSIKRIALVAVSALGFGLLSVVPSNAAISFTGMYVTNKSSSSLLYATGPANATAFPGTAAVTSGATTVETGAAHGMTASSVGRALYSASNGFIGTIASITDTDTFELAAGATATLSTGSNGAANQMFVGSIASTQVANPVLAATQISGLTATAGRYVGLEIKGGANAAAAGQVRALVTGVGVISGEIDNATTSTFFLSFTAPAAAGTYPMTIEYSEDGAFDGATANQYSINFTLTVTAASDLSVPLSTAYLAGPGVSGDATTNLYPVTAYKTNGTGVGTVTVTLKKGDTTAATGHTVRATMTAGAGFVGVDTTLAHAATTTRSASATVNSSGVAYVDLTADGNAGEGTVLVEVVHSVTGVASSLGTFKFTAYGDVATLSVDAKNFTIGLAGGGTTGRAVATRTATGDSTSGTNFGRAAQSTSSTRPAFVIKTTDSAGNVANVTGGGVPSVVSSNAAVVTGGTCVLDDGTTIYSSGDGWGYYNCNFSTAVSAKSGDKATLTFRIVDPADATKFITTTADVTVGGAIYPSGTESMTFDKASYAPSEAMVVTQTCKDASGNPCADGEAAPAVTFTKAMGGSAIAAGYYVGGTRATSTAYPSVFAPAVAGAFEGRIVSSNAALTLIKVTATVADDVASAAANAAADAAAEAIDAANAATDAANLAAEAADAATVAAEEARDAADAATAAVEKLASDVATLMAALKAQITTLANTVAKIAKKVRA